jgi:hypothetical protein
VSKTVLLEAWLRPGHSDCVSSGGSMLDDCGGGVTRRVDVLERGGRLHMKRGYCYRLFPMLLLKSMPRELVVVIVLAVVFWAQARSKPSKPIGRRGL